MIRSRIASQSLFRAKLSSVMKKLRRPCATFSRMIFLHVIRRTPPRLPPLHVNDCAKRTLEWATASSVETGHLARRARRADRGNEWQRFAFDVRQVRHVVVHWLERARESILQHLFQPSFRFAGKKRDAHCLGAMEIGIVSAQHAHRARDMEPAQRHLHAAFQQRLRQVERVRELIRLHTDHHHHAGTCILDHPCQSFRTHPRVRLVEWMDLDLDVVPEDCRCAQSRASPYTAASEFDGMVERNH